MTRLIGGTISDTPIKDISDGSAFSAGAVASGADHSNTIFLVSGEAEKSNVNAGPLTYYGNASIGTTNALTAKGWSNAFQFDGTGDYVDFKIGPASTNNRYYTMAGGSSPVDLAIEVYLKSAITLSGNNRGIWAIDSTSWVSMVYRQTQDNIAHYTNKSPWLTPGAGPSSSDMGTGWHHVRVVYDASESDAYWFLDGTHVATKVGTGANNAFLALSVGTDSISLGRLYGWGGTDWNGQICGFAASIGFTASTDSFTPPTLSQMQSGDWINKGY